MNEPDKSTDWVYLGATVLIGGLMFTLGVLAGVYYASC